RPDLSSRVGLTNPCVKSEVASTSGGQERTPSASGHRRTNADKSGQERTKWPWAGRGFGSGERPKADKSGQNGHLAATGGRASGDRWTGLAAAGSREQLTVARVSDDGTSAAGERGRGGDRARAGAGRPLGTSERSRRARLAVRRLGDERYSDQATPRDLAG